MVKEMVQDYTGEAKDPKATGKVLANLQKELNTIDREIQWKTENKELGKDEGQNDKIGKRRGIADKIDELKGRLQQWKKERAYKKYASKLSKKHHKELMQKPTEKDLKKATGVKSVLIDSKSGLNFVKTEAGYLQAWKNRAGDNLKKSIMKKNYKTRVYDIYRKDKNGNLVRAKQVTTYKMDSKGNGRFEALTFYANGNIDRFSENYVRGEKSMSRTEKIIKPDSLKNQFKSLENSKSQRAEIENIARRRNEYFKTVGVKNEIVKDANIKKSEHQFSKNEKSEFENDIYRESKFSKSHEGEVENLKSEGRNFEKSEIEK